MSELGQFVASIPPVTRTLTITSLVMGGLNALGIMSYSAFTPYFPDVWNKWEFHRLLTGFLISHPQPMQGLMEIYMLYSFSKGLEEGKFTKNLPDYLYYYIIIVPIILISYGLLLPTSFSLNPALLAALTFTWSIDNYRQEVNFYFMPIKASLLPVVSLGFRLLVDGRTSFFLALSGSFSAYIYNCLETRSFGPLMSLIQTPDNNANNNRLGTINSVNVWHYSTGHLSAPVWLKSLISKYTGIDYNSAAFKRSYGTVIPPKNRTDSRSGSDSSKSTSFSRAGAGSAAFKGKGRRLGSIDN